MAQLKQTCSVTNGSQQVTLTGDFTTRIKKDCIFLVDSLLVPYTVASDSTFASGKTTVVLTGAYQGATNAAAPGVFANDMTYPGSIPTIAQGDVGTAAVFTKAMYKVQDLIQAIPISDWSVTDTASRAYIANKPNFALVANPTFTGSPSAPTPVTSDVGGHIATTAYVHTAIGQELQKSVAGGVDVTLTALEAGNGVLNIFGTLTANINLVLPTANRKYVVYNNTSGAYTLTLKTATGPTVTITQKKWMSVIVSSGGVYPAFTDTANLVLSPSVTATTAAVADNTTAVATTAFVQAGMAAFGIGNISAAPLILSLDDVTVGAGMYYVNGSTTVGTYPNGASVPGFVLHKVYGGSGFQLFQPYGADRLYFRRRIGSAWIGWVELAGLASPAFTGTPTAPTAAANTNTTQIATTAFVGAALASLVNSSPAALDTLNELATALGNDPNFATTMTNALAAKAPLASPTISSPTFTGTPVAPTAATNTKTTQLATTAFVQAQLNVFGVGITTSASPTPDLDDVTLPSGMYYADNVTTVGTYPIAAPGFVLHKVYGAAGFQMFQPFGSDRLFFRRRASSAWVAWVELATAASVAGKAALAGSSTQNFAANDMAMNSMNGGQLAGFRNVLINGDMRVAQRTLPISVGLCLDRWVMNIAGSGLPVTQVNGYPLAGEALSVVMNVQGAAGNTDHNVMQRIEAANSRYMAGKVVTMSFWHFNNTGASKLVKCAMEYATAGFDNFSTTTSIGASAGTTCPNGQWTLVTGTFTVPAAATNGIQVFMGWGFGALVAGQSVGYGNAQLELGSVATPFEHRPYGTELALCQRYYEAISWPAAFTGGGGGTTNVYYMPVSFKVTKRVVPSVTLPSSTNAAWDANGGNITPTTWSLRDLNTGGFSMIADSGVRVGGIVANVYLASAEL